MSNLFIKFTGIEGSATAQGYQGWSNLHSMHVNISRHVDTQPGKTNDRVKGHPVFSGLTVIKPTDESTNRLLQYICSGEVISQVEIHACTTNAGFEPYEKYLLENVFIAGFDKALVQHGEPAEQLHLDFTSIRHTYLPRDTTHMQSAPSTGGYDLTKATLI